MHDNLGTIFLQGLDKLIVYNLVASLRRLSTDFDMFISGGNSPPDMKKQFEKKDAILFIQDLKRLDMAIKGNFESLEENFLTNGYQKLLKMIPPFMDVIL